MSLKYNDDAEQLLSKHGFECEPEPEWVVGKVPDFFCAGKFTMWVEVKSLDPPEKFKSLGHASPWFEKWSRSVQSHGRAFAYVSDDASERDIRVALAISDEALRRLTEGHDEARRVFVIIPKDPEYGEYVRIIAQSDSGKEVFHCCKSATGKYGRPDIEGNIRCGKPAVVIDQDNNHYQASPVDLGLMGDNFVLALKLELADEPFNVSAQRRSAAVKSSNVKKIRRIADYANSQFRNSCTRHNAPCLLMIFQEDILFSEDPAVVSAFYGDRQLFIPGNESMSFGPNGVWGPNKNRTT